MKRLIILAALLGCGHAAQASSVDTSTLFECRFAGTQPGEQDFVLFIERRPGNNFAGRDTSVRTIDAAGLLPVTPSYSLNYDWPNKVAVVGASKDAGMSTFMMRGRALTKAPIFATTSLDPAGGSADATIAPADGSVPLSGTCKIHRAESAATRFQELNK